MPQPVCAFAPDHEHPFMATIYPSSKGHFLHDNAQWQKAKVVSNWFHEYDNELSVLHWLSLSPDLNPLKHLWVVVVQEIQSAREKSDTK